jgi:hypothetical protein
VDRNLADFDQRARYVVVGSRPGSTDHQHEVCLSRIQSGAKPRAAPLNWKNLCDSAAVAQCQRATHRTVAIDHRIPWSYKDLHRWPANGLDVCPARANQHADMRWRQIRAGGRQQRACGCDGASHLNVLARRDCFDALDQV